MTQILEENYYIYRGLYTALARTRSSAQNVYYKVLAAQHHYFRKSSGLYFTDNQEMSNALLDGAMHKFYLGAYSLEQLWGVHHYLEVTDRGLPDFYDVNLTTWQNETVFMLSALLDQALYNWRSFLDYYLKYLLHFCTGNYIPTMSIKSFKKNILNDKNRSSLLVYQYLYEHVLCKTLGGDKVCWGDLLKSLRDKTTHQKLIAPVIVEKENTSGYSITWPTINGQNYSELAQLNFENNAFEMIRAMFPILYNLEWVTGPFKPGMYNHN